MNAIEKYIHHILRYHPGIRKPIALAYKCLCYPFGGKEVLPNITSQHLKQFFGFHDKSPWNSSGNKVLTHQLSDQMKNIKDVLHPVEIGYIDATKNSFIKIGETNAWNWQQGATLQWIGNTDVISYHTIDKNRVESVWHDTRSNINTRAPHEVAAIDPTGKVYASFSFLRFGHGAPGYGYPHLDTNCADLTAQDDASICLYRTEDHQLIKRVTLNDLLVVNTSNNGFHYFSHTLFSPDGKKLAFFHRWSDKTKAIFTHFYILDIDSEKLRLIDAEDASHITWISDNEIVAFCIPTGKSANYYIFNVENGENKPLDCQAFTCDGHPHACRTQSLLVTDTYPDKYGFMHLYTYDLTKNQRKEVGKFKSPLSSRGIWRCDLHPRLSPDGRKISIDLPDKDHLRKHMIIEC